MYINDGSTTKDFYDGDRCRFSPVRAHMNKNDMHGFRFTRCFLKKKKNTNHKQERNYFRVGIAAVSQIHRL
jgi:hypothetical protein